MRAIAAPLIAPARWPTRPGDDARIVDDGPLAGRDLLRVEAADGAFARLAPDLGRWAQLGAMRLGLGFIVALHGRALAGDRRGGQAEARGEIGAGEPVRRGKHQPAERPAGGGAAGIADPGNRARGILDGERDLGQLGRRRDRGIEEVVVGDIAGEAFAIGKAGIGILGRDLGHGDCTLGELRRIGEDVGRDALPTACRQRRGA